MAPPIQPPPGKLSIAEHLRWTEAQPRGRFELVDGEVFAMAPERVGHTRVKGNAWLARRNAIKAAGVDAKAYISGVAMQEGEATLYEPDALVNGGEIADRDAMIAPDPVVVVEVVTAASRGVDTAYKLVDYFSVPSIRHLLLALADKRVVIHYARRGSVSIETRIVPFGRIELDPPGMVICVEDLFED